ncbi:MAG: polysaccharide deacetylase family protein [Candidatus Subteraquimicrobiales bacterium]|nr:polysaccharide deacetylase family protein [Candidatus Subteraquimicrobiales bacterium]
MEEKEQKFKSRFFFGAIVVIFTVVSLLLFFLLRFIPVNLNGKSCWLRRGVTVAEMLEEGYVRVESGDLYDIEGKLLREGKGEPPRVFINGRRVENLATVFPRNRLLVLKGQDEFEQKTTQLEKVEPSWQLKSRGALLFVSREGSPGVKILTVGRVSGKVSYEECVRNPKAHTVERFERRVGKIAVLTFDDGPNSRHTKKILDILKEHNVRATFFVTGGNVLRNPEILKRTLNEGHEIGNHTLSHPNLKELGAEEIREEIILCEEAIYRIIGVYPKCFRPPYGNMDEKVFKAAHSLGYEVALWSVSLENRFCPTPKLMQLGVSLRAHDGLVILAHDGGKNRKNTIKALPAIIKELKGKGYEFVTFSEFVLIAKGVVI